MSETLLSSLCVRWSAGAFPCLLAGLLVGSFSPADALALAGSPAPASPSAPARVEIRITPQGSEVPSYLPDRNALELGLAGYAKVVCSAVFVSGRDPGEAFRDSGYLFVPAGDRDRIEPPWVDRDRALVTLRADGISRTARFYGDQGCVIDPVDGQGIRFEPKEVRTSLPAADEQPWPMGDAAPATPLPAGVDADELRLATDAAFASGGMTQAFLVVHKGQIVAERYADGVDKDTQLESWSMGKSLTATLAGVLVREGALSLQEPAPVPEWHEDPADPRAQIRIVDLLRMSSGLRFSTMHDPDLSTASGYPDDLYVHSGAVDAFAYAVDRPLQSPPDTVGRDSDSDPLALGYAMRRIVEARGEDYLAWPQRALFDRIGIRRQVLETDPWGNLLLTGYDYGTARNWARLGMLYLQDGVWNGERILPQGYAEFVSTPAPAWDKPVYGGLFWINSDSAWNLPTDAYYMAGSGGQRVFVVPTHDLVVVRLGHLRGDEPGLKALNDALAHLMRAVPRTRDDTAPGSHLWGPELK